MAFFSRFGTKPLNEMSPPPGVGPVGEAPPPPSSPSHSPTANSTVETITSDKRQRLISAKIDIHQVLLEMLNLHLLDSVPRDVLREQIDNVVLEEVRKRAIALNKNEYQSFIEEIIDEMVGLGPLETLLKDDTIADILINSHEHIFVERFGQLEYTQVRFRDEAHLMRVINKIVSAALRCAPCRWLAHQRCGAPDHHRRAVGIDPQILQEEAFL
jgi:pilus assembly protein CpaF